MTAPSEESLAAARVFVQTPQPEGAEQRVSFDGRLYILASGAVWYQYPNGTWEWSLYGARNFELDDPSCWTEVTA